METPMTNPNDFDARGRSRNGMYWYSPLIPRQGQPGSSDDAARAGADGAVPTDPANDRLPSPTLARVRFKLVALPDAGARAPNADPSVRDDPPRWVLFRPVPCI